MIMEYFIKDVNFKISIILVLMPYNIRLPVLYNMLYKLNGLPKIEPCSYDVPKQCLKDLSKIKSQHVYNIITLLLLY